MQIQVNTANTIAGHEPLLAHVEEVLEHGLARFKGRLTRVEAHFSGHPGEGDMRCTVEARIEGRAPVVASHEAVTLDQSLTGALTRLKRSLDTELDRVRDHHRR